MFIALLSAAYITGCGAQKSSSSIASQILERTWTAGQISPLPKAYCMTPLPYSGGITISGRSTYEFRPVSIELGEEGLREVSDETRPIRHAQFDVTDASGNILQCGETDGDGNFSFTVPSNKKALSIQVYSRSNNLFNMANVYIAPETNELHKLQHFFTANNSQSNILLVAEGDRTTLGGAFNILDQVHNSFDQLRLNTTIGIGLDLELIPAVDIYWEAGFSPIIYTQNQESHLSFFSGQAGKLFILGGIDGDTSFSDTDHYDNSIILHEYFHFLENNISRVNSPGGPHSGNELLDPRLAWSEGAAQFYQAFVTGIPSVLDTRGNTDGSTGFILKLSVENETNDLPLTQAEGEFREFAVARLLWDMHDDEIDEDAPEEFDNIDGLFPDIWGTLTSTINAFSFVNVDAQPISVSSLTNILNIETTITDDGDWYKLLTRSFVANTTTYLDDNDTPGVPGDDVVFGPDFHSFRAGYGQKLEPGPPAFQFEFSEPFASPQSNPLNNHPVLGIHYYSLIVPTGNTSNVNLDMTRVNNTNGDLRVYVFDVNFNSLLDDALQGPVAANINIPLTAGTYIIMVALSESPSAVDPLLPASLTYNFVGLAKGAF